MVSRITNLHDFVRRSPKTRGRHTTLFLGRTAEVPFTPVFAYVTPVVGVISFSFGLAYAFWRVGLNHYQSTGS